MAYSVNPMTLQFWLWISEEWNCNFHDSLYNSGYCPMGAFLIHWRQRSFHPTLMCCTLTFAVWLVAGFMAPVPAPSHFLPQGNIQKSFTQPAIKLYRVLAWRHINTHQGARVVFKNVWHGKLLLYVSPPAIFIFFIIRVTYKKYCHAHSTFWVLIRAPFISQELNRVKNGQCHRFQ